MSETLVSLWTDVRKRLEAAGVDTPVLDARLLLEAGAGVSRLEIVTDPRRIVDDAQVEAVNALTQRREAREPGDEPGQFALVEVGKGAVVRE